jgi:anhydro-N-acetylmuramic acid kinase
MALKPLKAIGLMSGTSLDGIDVALLETDGEKIHGFGPSFFRPYSDDEREIIEQATQAALKWNFDSVPPNIFAYAEEIVDQAHIEALQDFIKENGVAVENIDLIGYHGQTILHRPPENGKNGQTLQLGDGSKIANGLGVDTVFDFRSNDMQQGGQGAPLAPIYHKALVENAGLVGTTGVLNVGGVSNITVISSKGEMIATDCGPGNGPLDSWVAQNGAGSYDKDGRYAMEGTPDFALIARWLERDFFDKPIPKSADRWDFDVLEDLRGLSLENGAATLVAFTAHSIADTLRNIGQEIDNIIVCGGGRRNPAVMAALTEELNGNVQSAETIGWQGDDIEAQAFAFLSVRHINKLPLSYPSTTGVNRRVSGGRLAKPVK